jgi:hypothetical protein
LQSERLSLLLLNSEISGYIPENSGNYKLKEERNIKLRLYKLYQQQEELAFVTLS